MVQTCAWLHQVCFLNLSGDFLWIISSNFQACNFTNAILIERLKGTHCFVMSLDLMPWGVFSGDKECTYCGFFCMWRSLTYVSSWAFCKCFPFHSKEDKKKTFVYLPLAVIFVVELVVSLFFSCLGCLKKKMDFWCSERRLQHTRVVILKPGFKKERCKVSLVCLFDSDQLGQVSKNPGSLVIVKHRAPQNPCV